MGYDKDMILLKSGFYSIDFYSSVLGLILNVCFCTFKLNI